MRRQTRRPTRLSRPLTAEQRVRALLPYSWVEADNVVVSANKVTDWTDKVLPGTGVRAITAAHAFSQGSGALQVATPTVDSAVLGKMSASFTSAQEYPSNSAASSWKHLHDGTGATTFVVVSTIGVGATYGIFGSTGGSSGTGALVYQNGTSTEFRTYKAGVNIAGPSVAGASTATPYVYKVQSATANNPDTAIKRNTTSGAGQDYSSAASSADSTFTMTIGSVANGAFKATMSLCAWINFNRSLSAADEAIVRAYLASKYGIVT